MSNDDPQRRSVGARLSPDLNEYVADWFLTPSSRSDVVDVVLEPPCQCGSCLGEIFRTTRYGRVFGPVYWGEVTLASYAGWERLVAGGRASREEREILIAMSENEGKIDAVQSYDSEILTAGAMQKTINPQGKGELPKQVLEFKQEHPALYEALFARCGWEVSDGDEPTMYFRGQTGASLKELIRDGFTASTFEDRTSRQSAPLAAIVNAILSDRFQDKQVEDFVRRLRKVLALRPRGRPAFPIARYITSRFGKAVLLDQHVNRPAYVSRDFGSALERFSSEVPDASADPAGWGVQRSSFEMRLLDIYGELREMTDSRKRFEALRQKLQ